MATRVRLPTGSPSCDRSGFCGAKSTAVSRRHALGVGLSWIGLLAGGPGLAVSRATPAPSVGPSVFQNFVAMFRAEAVAQGVPATLYDETMGSLTLDPTVAAMTRRQPEFVKPIGAYLATQVTAGRIAAGRAALDRWRKDLVGIAGKYGVPPALIVAIWGLETNYGEAGGTKDVIRSMATLAAMNYRPDLYHAELIAAFAMLRDGGVTRPMLRGSWAGAMGQPQFMPSSYRRYAVDWNGNGRPDIWTNVPDSLASIANFIRAQGWLPGQPWGFEVALPAGYDMRAPSRDGFSAWPARGVRRVDGKPMPAEGTGILFFPAGAAGPAFLATTNFEVIKTYNMSDAYVLSVAQLADRMEGGAAIQASWPTDIPMAREARIALQTQMVAHGYAVDDRQGRISLALRDVIRTAQEKAGMVPDGNPTDALLNTLGGALVQP